MLFFQHGHGQGKFRFGAHRWCSERRLKRSCYASWMPNPKKTLMSSQTSKDVDEGLGFRGLGFWGLGHSRHDFKAAALMHSAQPGPWDFKL